MIDRHNGLLVRTLRLRTPIYSTPLLEDVDGDGRLELFVTAGRVFGFRVRRGMGASPEQLAQLDRSDPMRWSECLEPLPGWPRAGRGPFASSPRAGDIDGDGKPEILAGSDDNALYAWRLNGTPVPGFPFETGGDVYSTPALADLDGDGRMEIVFGSDDGCVYAVNGEGKLLPGWPVSTGGFVASSPAVADLDGDGRPEIVIGSWDRMLYVIDARGEIWSNANGHPGWPLPLGHIIWSSPLVCDLDGDGRPEIAVAADRLHVVDVTGRPLPGWPCSIGGFTVSSPVAIRFPGEAGPSLVIGGERLHAFDAHGRTRAGFPRALGGHIWARPLGADIDGRGHTAIFAGAWGGMLDAVAGDGTSLPGFPLRTHGAIFGGASCAARPPARTGASQSDAPGDAGSGCIVAFGSTDGELRLIYPKDPVDGGATHVPSSTVSLAPAASPSAGDPGPVLPMLPPSVLPPSVLPPSVPAPSAPSPPVPLSAARLQWTFDPAHPLAGRPLYLRVAGIPSEAVRAGFVHYRWKGSTLHPSPLVPSNGGLVGLIQPLPAGAEVRWYLTLEGWNGDAARFPAEGDETFRVRGTRLGRVRRYFRV